MLAKQFARFLLCGGLAAAVNIGMRWLLSHWLAYTLAIVLAFGFGLLTGYVLFKFAVFDSAGTKRIPQEAGWYVLVNVLALAQTLGISLLLARWLFPCLGMTLYAEDVAHVIGVGLPVITSFFLHKHLTFRKNCHERK